MRSKPTHVNTIRQIPVVGNTAAAVIYVLLAVAVVGALCVLLHRPRRIAWAAGSTLLLLAASVFALTVWPKPFPDAVPVRIYAAGAAAVFVAFAAVFAPRRRLPLVLLAVPSLLLGYLGANLVYQQYPTVGSFHPEPVTVAMSLDEFQSRTSAPLLNGREVGALVTLPAEPMRDAVAYVPPAYFHGATLPVMVLLSGQPGMPSGWFTDGQADRIADDFQQEHGGQAPIVVSVDGTGSTTGNPACVDGPNMKMQTYLAEDIPALIKRDFRVVQDQAKWTIGGLSYGGTCALQVITNAPDAYGTFLDFSGEPEPSIGSHEKTVNELFGGDEEAFGDVNPSTLLVRAAGSQKYAHTAGRFVAGESDPMASRALPHLNTLAQEAGMNTTYTELPGGHSYQVWRVALRDSFGFAAERGGIK